MFSWLYVDDGWDCGVIDVWWEGEREEREGWWEGEMEESEVMLEGEREEMEDREGRLDGDKEEKSPSGLGILSSISSI